MNILISGGSDGIGLETSKLLAKDHNVISMSPSKKKLEKVSTENNFDHFVGDVSKWKDCEAAVKYVVEKYSQLDVLVNNAGLDMYGELEEVDPEKIERLIQVNYLGMILLTKAAIPHLKQNKYSIVININSQASRGISIGRSVYYSSKWATDGFTKNIAKELAQYSIRVTGIYPGAVKTKLGVKAGKNRDMSDAVSALDVARTIEFVLNQREDVVIPELGVRHIEN